MRWNRWIWISAALMGISMLVAAAAVAQNETPDAVQDRVSELFPRRKLDIYPERLGQRTVYEAGTGTRLEVSLDRRGKIVEVEARVPIGLIPEAAREAAHQEFGKDARITEGELVVRGDTLLYELEVKTAEADEQEIYLRPDGSRVESDPG